MEMRRVCVRGVTRWQKHWKADLPRQKVAMPLDGIESLRLYESGGDEFEPGGARDVLGVVM